MRDTKVCRIAVCLALFGVPLAAQEPVQSSSQIVEPAGAVMRANSLILPQRTRIPFVVSQEISSKKARKGDLIKLTLRDDLVFEGAVVVPAGTPAVGEISKAQKKGFMGEGGRLSARMLYFDLPTGPVRISGPLASLGDDQTELATLATTATLGIAFFVTGKSAVIPAGAELSVLLDREARIPHRVQEQAPPEQTDNAPEPSPELDY
ncbi:MAG: hypothetical protein AAGK01_14400 [Pseudomonadota bacterium]